MAVNFANDLLTPNFGVWARPITVTPVVSAPAAAAYGARGVYGTQALDLLGEDSLISTQQTILDIIDDEFLDAGHALPQQGDRINIPASGGLRALGDFEVVSSAGNGGGETTLELRQWEATP
jgi:hypothetical protein